MDFFAQQRIIEGSSSPAEELTAQQEDYLLEEEMERLKNRGQELDESPWAREPTMEDITGFNKYNQNNEI